MCSHKLLTFLPKECGHRYIGFPQTARNMQIVCSNKIDESEIESVCKHTGKYICVVKGYLTVDRYFQVLPKTDS